MGMGTNLNVLIDRIGATLTEGAGLSAEEAEKQGLGNKAGARVLNAVNDVMFKGQDRGGMATTKSRLVGGAAVAGGVVGAGVALQAAQDHPVLATGAVIGAGALALSDPSSLMTMARSVGQRFSNIGEARDVAKGVGPIGRGG